VNSPSPTLSPSDGAREKTLSVTRHPSPVTHLARIEVGATELPRLLENGLSARIAEALKKIGYAHVTLYLLGYRRGSLNETTTSQTRQS
jgi:PP-loop superfamily ATP-utilizing enzyme